MTFMSCLRLVTNLVVAPQIRAGVNQMEVGAGAP